MNKKIKYKCICDYYNFDNLLCFKKGDIYTFEKISTDCYVTQKNHQGFEHELDNDTVSEVFQKVVQLDETIETPKHYDNSKGTLYKVATERCWNPYLFDIVKRLERAEKKGEFKTDLEKSINVIKLWLKEYENTGSK